VNKVGKIPRKKKQSLSQFVKRENAIRRNIIYPASGRRKKKKRKEIREKVYLNFQTVQS